MNVTVAYQKGLSEKLKQIDWDGWLYGTGLGPVKNQYDTSLADQAIDLAKRYPEYYYYL